MYIFQGEVRFIRYPVQPYVNCYLSLSCFMMKRLFHAWNARIITTSLHDVKPKLLIFYYFFSYCFERLDITGVFREIKFRKWKYFLILAKNTIYFGRGFVFRIADYTPGCLIWWLRFDSFWFFPWVVEYINNECPFIVQPLPHSYVVLAPYLIIKKLNLLESLVATDRIKPYKKTLKNTKADKKALQINNNNFDYRNRIWYISCN